VPPPVLVEFVRTKYGRPLLIDAGFVSRYAGFLQRGQPHTLGFFDLLLVTRGHGELALDAAVHAVTPHCLFFTRPGDVRRWAASSVDGACIFFTEEFVAHAFSNPRFLSGFGYFGAERPSGVLHLSPAQSRWYLDRFSVMRGEIARLRADAPEALRAILYEVLVTTNRWYRARYAAATVTSSNALVDRFQQSVEREFRRCHRVRDFASDLGVSPGHLNALCREHVRRTAGGLIRARLSLEARRLLLHTNQTAAEIAYSLGFDDPAYFARFFRRETGVTTTEFRRTGAGVRAAGRARA
jgi:AraC-like DNA-binding protein